MKIEEIKSAVKKHREKLNTMSISEIITELENGNTSEEMIELVISKLLIYEDMSSALRRIMSDNLPKSGYVYD